MMPMQLEEIARPFGSATGISFVAGKGDTTFKSYDELARLGAAFACAVGKRTSRDEPVGLVLHNDVESVIAVLGTWMGGHPLVSIPPPARGVGLDMYARGFGDVLSRIGCRLVFADRRTARALGEGVRCEDLAQTVASLEPSDVCGEQGLPPQALVQFTSGSTSMPRGVVVAGEVVAGHLAAIDDALELEHGDRGLSWLPLHHDMGFIGFLMVSLANRQPLTLMDPTCFVRNPLRWLTQCADDGVTITGAPNFGFRLATKALRHGNPTLDLSRMRHCLAGAERISATTLHDFAAAAENARFSASALMPVYGMAETTLGACFPPPGRGLVEGPDDTVSVGRPLPGLEMRVSAPDPAGRGAIDLRGDWLFDGYATASGFTEAAVDDGWFRTSDIGCTDGDELFVVGRADEVVVHRGRNIYAEDLESVAARTAGDLVSTVAAFKSGVGADSFVVAIELAPRVLLDGALPRQVANAITEGVGLHAERVVVCRPGSIPLTTSGKVRRSACRDLYASGLWATGD